MDNLRREELLDNWEHETNESWTQEWREELSPGELEYVAQLDSGYRSGVRRLCTDILIQEEIRRQFRPSEIQELEHFQDHCRLRLRDGRMYLARLDREGGVRLEEIEVVC